MSENIKYQMERSSSDLDLAVTILRLTSILFLPQLLLSLVTTLNFRDKSSLKILYRHPSLFILPTVTFFTFSRLDIGCCCCCSENNRVSFSKKFTWLNIAVSTIGYLVLEVWYYFSFPDIFWFILLIIPLLVVNIVITALFLCGPLEQLSVYDPDLDKRFIIVNGKVVEDLEDDDIETPEVTIPTVDVSSPQFLTLNGVTVK